MNNPLGKSVLGIDWHQKEYSTQLALTIFQKSGVSEILSRLLASRNIAIEEIENFLNPTIKANLPDPFLLYDMDIAAQKIIQAIKQQRKITVFGDYDVDGATSSALLKRFFRMIGVTIDIYIPDRILEGYGPNTEALLNLKKNGTDLLITVDCGTVAFEPLKTANDAGLEVIVIDHHLGATEKPEAIAIINPNRLDEQFEHKNLAAVGVCFLLCVAVNKRLREEKFYEQKKISEPKLLNLLDLVALGTVCDVVPLNGVNRSLVAQGLKVMKNRENTGLRTLCDIAGLNEAPNSYHLGFMLGPRINAGGRIGKSDLGARLLSTDDIDEAKHIASELNILNNQRKDIEQNALKEAIEQIEKKQMQQQPVIFAVSPNWHPGVIGIVAARIKELYNRPTAIIALDNGVGKASCRSIPAIDFGSMILQAKLAGLIIEGGGHRMAAGFSVREEMIDKLHNFLCQLSAKTITNNGQKRYGEFADILDITSANLNLAKEITALEPYGAGNAKPIFMIRDLVITNARTIGSDNSHVSCIFSSKNILGWQGRLSGVAFKAMENKLGEILIAKNNSRSLGIIGQISINSWMGNENIQIIIEDVLI